MAAMSAAITVSGAAVAAPATTLSSSTAFGSSGVQQFAPKQSPANSKVVAALVAAGAALALNFAPVSPASAGFFGGNVQVERSATAPDFPGNEGTGTKVGSNAGVRGSANAGTPLGEGAGGNLVGDNQSTRQASSTGTPFGEGSSTGSGVNVGAVLKVPDVGNPLNKIGDANPLKLGIPDASSIVSDAKSAAQNLAGDAKSKINTDGLPDASRVVGDAKNKVNGMSNPIENGKEVASNVASLDGVEAVKNGAGDVAKSAAQGVATNAAQDLVENAKSSIGSPTPWKLGRLS